MLPIASPGLPFDYKATRMEMMSAIEMEILVVHIEYFQTMEELVGGPKM